MANEDIKNLIRKHRLFRYEVADAMGISEGYLSTLLRSPLSDEHRKQIIEAVNKLTNNLHELMQQVEEEELIKSKAMAFENMCTLLNNALCYMYEQGMSKEECAKYIGTTVDVIDAVEIEDVYTILEN